MHSAIVSGTRATVGHGQRWDTGNGGRRATVGHGQRWDTGSGGTPSHVYE